MKLALLPKMLFHESDLNANRALMLRSASSVIEKRCDRLDLVTFQAPVNDWLIAGKPWHY